MNKDLKAFRRKFQKRLDNYVDMSVSCCGHEPETTISFQEGDKLVEWVMDEIERLQKVALAESVRNGGPG